MGVGDPHGVLPYKFELHYGNVVLDISQINAFTTFLRLFKSLLSICITIHYISNELALLTLGEQLVSIIGFLVHLVEVHGAGDLDEFRYRALFEDFMSSLFLDLILYILFLKLCLVSRFLLLIIILLESFSVELRQQLTSKVRFPCILGVRPIVCLFLIVDIDLLAVFVLIRDELCLHILRERVPHVALEFGDGKVQLILVLVGL